jgi:hypothetical protein
VAGSAGFAAALASSKSFFNLADSACAAANRALAAVSSLCFAARFF